MDFLLEEAPGNASCCQGKSGYIPLNWLANIRIGQRCSPMWELSARKRPYSMPEKQKKWEYRTIAATPPFYFGFSDKEMAGYYYDIAEAVDMPVLYYNIPSSTHRELNPSQPDLAALLKSGAVGAIKHTNLNLYQMERIHDVIRI